MFGYALGLDMTRRDLQAEATRAGPGTWSKPSSGPPRRARLSGIGDRPPGAGLDLAGVNDELRQHGDLSQQFWKVPETIAFLRTVVELRPGDLIMTGTPKGVGPVRRGDRLVGHIDGVGDLEVEYRA